MVKGECYHRFSYNIQAVSYIVKQWKNPQMGLFEMTFDVTLKEHQIKIN